MRVIDTLVLELSLDPSKLSRGQRNAIRDLRQFEDQARRSANKGEADARRQINTMEALKKGVVGLVAGYSAVQIARFTANLWQADAAIGRTARTANTSARTLATWQNAVKLIGGTAEEATSALATLSGEIEDLQQGKGGGSFMKLLGAYSVDWRGRDGKTRDPGEIFNELQEKMSRSGLSPAAQRSQLQTMGGMSEGMINLLTQNRGEFMRLISAGAASAPTKEDTEAAKRAAESMEQVSQAGTKLFRVLTTLAEGPLVKLLEWVTRIFGEGGAGFKPEIVPGGIADRVRNSSGVRWLGSWLGSVPNFSATGSSPQTEPGAQRAAALAQAAAESRLADEVALRVKAGAGLSGTHAGTQALARDLHDLPGFNRITAGNDAFHRGRPSAHNRGLALDFSINDKEKSAEAANALRAKLKELGINATVLDEYARPGFGSTGGHIHVQFASEADAARYAAGRATRAGSGAAASAASLRGTAAGGASTTSNEVNIGQITIQTDGDPDSIAKGLKGSIENVGLAASVNSGLQ